MIDWLIHFYCRRLADVPDGDLYPFAPQPEGKCTGVVVGNGKVVILLDVVDKDVVL